MKYYVSADLCDPAEARLLKPPFRVAWRVKNGGALVSFDETALPILRELAAAAGWPRCEIWDRKRGVYTVTDEGLQWKERSFFPPTLHNLLVIQNLQRLPRIRADWDKANARGKAICEGMAEPGIVPDGRVPLFFRYKRFIYARPDWERPMRYSLRSPKTKQDIPLLIYLHGGGYNRMSGLKPMFGGYGALACRLWFSREKHHMLIPQSSYGFNWNTDEFTQGLNAVIDSLPHVDRSRVYIMGTSYGGYGAIMECCRSPRRFAACLPCVAAMWNMKDVNGEPCQQLDDAALDALAQTPIWMEYSGLERQSNEPLYEALKARGADVRKTHIRLRGLFGHVVSPFVFSVAHDWVKWMFEHNL